MESAPSTSPHTGLETSKVTKFTCGSRCRYYQSDGYCSETKPIRQQKELLTTLTDGIALAMNCLHDMNSTRRQSMKKDLHRDYAALCNATTVPSSSEFLFGDLSKLTKDISDANKLTKKVRPASHSSSRGRKSTFTNHYSANRNRRFAPYAYSRARYNDNNNFLSKSRSPPMKGKKEGITK